ncbi:MAG: hypothetical protein EOP86_08730 [Verrucomicrobiaceae bacterium]|nr:MAG: hypothetical protein EOP86_08730 [Verrucomicrobiaceae bacterium]
MENQLERIGQRPPRRPPPNPPKPPPGPPPPPQLRPPPPFPRWFTCCWASADSPLVATQAA